MPERIILSREKRINLNFRESRISFVCTTLWDTLPASTLCAQIVIDGTQTIQQDTKEECRPRRVFVEELARSLGSSTERCSLGFNLLLKGAQFPFTCVFIGLNGTEDVSHDRQKEKGSHWHPELCFAETNANKCRIARISSYRLSVPKFQTHSHRKESGQILWCVSFTWSHTDASHSSPHLFVPKFQ